MSRKILIGDVHGCSGELRELVERLRLQSSDHVIFLGDLIDKGPDSRAVLDMILALRDQTCQVTNLLGNHEEKFLRWLRHEELSNHTGMPNPIKDASRRMSDLARCSSEGHLALLRNAQVLTPGSSPT